MTTGTVTPVGPGPLTEQPAWKALEQHHRRIRSVHLRELFARDSGRGERLTVEAAGVYLDYSKNRITDETVSLLVRLAEDCGLRARINAMFRGEPINVSENRAVLHVALRAPRERVDSRRWQERGAGRALSARPDGGVCEPRAQRGVDRVYRQADPQRRQHWHRRLRSRPSHGL